MKLQKSSYFTDDTLLTNKKRDDLIFNQWNYRNGRTFRMTPCWPIRRGMTLFLTNEITEMVVFCEWSLVDQSEEGWGYFQPKEFVIFNQWNCRMVVFFGWSLVDQSEEGWPYFNQWNYRNRRILRMIPCWPIRRGMNLFLTSEITEIVVFYGWYLVDQ